MNKKGIAPLLATFLLIIFAMILGSVVMSFGKDYMTNPEFDAESSPKENSLGICDTTIDLGPLKDLQIMHINGIISSDEYFEMEKNIK